MKSVSRQCQFKQPCLQAAPEGKKWRRVPNSWREAVPGACSCHGKCLCRVPFLVYSALNNGVTFESGVGVVKGHWQWNRSIDHIWYSRGCHCKYCSILYHFRVTWRWIISWLWNLGWRSLKVIETGTIRKRGYGFLFPFFSNYGFILYHFRDKARYWSKITIFIPPCIRRPC